MGSLTFNQIELVGFKSFVEPTRFQIKPGLTGIVGPNGCGKSNLLESIRWVMGANSAKAMRGKSMDDVIFLGTKTRPSRGQASVTLTIDNSARVAPSMFNDDEILEVTRTITRGSGSKYTINGKTVRAKDVQLLFADASSGANSPALVRQNQISDLINAKPENRRRILEEAAGISGLHTRRHEAELRLRAAETNLGRLDDVLAQIESQLLSLRRQSRQAARFKRLAAEIREFKTLLWIKRWQNALDTLTKAETELKQANDSVADLTSKTTKLSTKQAEISTRLEPCREEQIIAAAVCGRLNAAKEALENDAQAAKSEIKKLQARLDFLKGDIEREENIISDAKTASERLQAELDELEALKDIGAALNNAEKQAEKAINARNEIETQLAELTSVLADNKAKANAAQNELQRLQNQKNKIQTEIEKTKSALNSLKENNAIENDNLFATALDKAAKALIEAKKQEEKTINERETAEIKERETHNQYSQAKADLAEIEAEIKALSAMLGKEADDKWVAVLEKISVKKGYETALAAAFGDDLQAGTDENIPLRWQGAKSPNQDLPKNTRALSDFVTAPEELSARLAQIGVVNADEGKTISAHLKPGQKLVSQNGDVWRWDGFVASSEIKSASALRLENKNRLDEISALLPKAKNKLQTAKENWQNAQIARKTAIEQAREARQILADLESEERDARVNLSAFETERARKNAQISALEEKLAQLKTESKSNQEAIDNAQKLVSENNTYDELQNQVEQASKQLIAARDEADEASGLYRSLKNEASSRAQRLETVKREIDEWKKRSDLAKQHITSLEGRKAETEMALVAANDSPDEFTRRQQKLLSELSEAENRRQKASDALAEIENELRDINSELKQSEQLLGQAREERAASEARLLAASERKDEIKARINENLSCTPDDLSAQLENISPDSGLSEHDIERKLERLGREREKLGGVNLRADEEAAEQEERLNAMNEEREDLIAAIAKLREGIDSLNDEGRQRLLQAFDIVNGHFGRLFTTLFGGGEAALALTENEDPLNAGLEIMVRIPGEKLKELSLLSGGEQALTATALIFAVFLSNPAPLCVLDEVDAPLDDANVGRYCDLLDEMVKSTNTRFIIITHNAVTMARMDRLFGVTMAEQGVSQLVSIDLGEAEKLSA